MTIMLNCHFVVVDRHPRQSRMVRQRPVNSLESSESDKHSSFVDIVPGGLAHAGSEPAEQFVGCSMHGSHDSPSITLARACKDHLGFLLLAELGGARYQGPAVLGDERGCFSSCRKR